MALETAFAIAGDLLSLNPFILIGIVFVFAFVAYKVFALVLKILVTGLAFAAFPVIANIVGIGVPLTPQSILWSAILGIMIYFVYMGIGFGYKIINLTLKPFGKMFSSNKVKKAKK